MLTTKDSKTIAVFAFCFFALGGCGGGGGESATVPNTGNSPALETPAETMPAAVTIISGKA